MYDKNLIQMTYAESLQVSKGHGLFPRQYVNLRTYERFECSYDCWESTRRAVMRLSRSGQLPKDERARLVADGRGWLNQHIQVLAKELDRYDLLDQYLDAS